MREIDAVVPPQVHTLLHEAYTSWTNNPAYLGVEAPYDTDCPPLLIMGGASVPRDAFPLVVLSLEPLKVDQHFDANAEFASTSFDHFVRWNWEYFSVARAVSGLAGYHIPGFSSDQPQRYWMAKRHLIDGYRDVTEALPAAGEVTDWGYLHEHYIELPLVPLHSPHNKPRAWRNVAHTIRKNFLTRIAVVRELWPRARFLALGGPVRQTLRMQRTQARHFLDIPVERTAMNEETYGSNLWARPVERLELSLGAQAVVEVACRAAISQSHQPRKAGIAKLGQALRQWKWCRADR